jgi:hypothetical protein
MTQLMGELGCAARSLVRQGVVVTVVLGLALGISASLALAALERGRYA